MSLLAAAQYDPAAEASKSISSLIALTALDTTNLRLTFTVPANGSVLVRLAGAVAGSTSFGTILLGVLEGATVRGRQSPIGAINPAALGTDLVGQEASFLVTGLTPGASLTWDAAYGVEVAGGIGASLLYGGPNNASGANAAGAFVFEVWDTISLLAGKLYDPAAAVQKSAGSLLAMTAIDTTNLRLTFTCPPSGKVYWRIRAAWTRGGANWGQILLGVLEGATVRARVAPKRGITTPNAASAVLVSDADGVVSGLTPGSSFTWDAAYAVQVVSSSANLSLSYGGPNDTTTNNAWGGFAFEIWAA